MSIASYHNEWLRLVPNSGPFVSLPVLTQVFPQGLDAHDPEHIRHLRRAFEEWDEDQSGRRPDPAIHRAWIKLVLAETLGFDELLVEGQGIPQTLKSEIAEYGETLRPDWVLNEPSSKKARLLVQTYPRSQSLTKPLQRSRWKTSPDTRMMQLLHDTDIRLGLVTNGEHWMLVNAPKNDTSGYVSWYASLWIDEPLTLQAFRTLLCAERFFGVSDKETIEALLDRSASDQQEVTDQLGYQVRKAVEVLIQSLDEADQNYGRKLLGGVDEKVLYEAALTVMMRLVFLFCAEERELLLLGDNLWDENYAVSTLREQLREAADQYGEGILALRYDAWTRLLTTFRAVYGGVNHDRFKIPAYGGSLFNPDRFPFLEGRKSGTSWKNTEAMPLPVNNRTVLHLLEALQMLQIRLPGGGFAEARKLSFRWLNIEQIGHVYEGLLDHTAKRATEPVLGLQGTREKEPEVPLSELEKISASGEKQLLDWLKEETGRSESALKKGLDAEIEDQLASRFRTVCQDSELWKQVEPFAGLVRLDTNGYPVVVKIGSIFVTAGTDRRSSGTHYTPRSLTEPIVQYTFEPLVYIGPADGLPKEQWKLRSAKELLDLKICDMTCGSGAFLVQGCRYLSARLLEAWDEVQRSTPGTVRITPEGEPSTGQPGEMLIPDEPDERQTYALRIVAQRCFYGVDKNPLAVEMAKLSLWLLTLARDKPFEFLDHAIRCGDSLVGISDLDQLRSFSLDNEGPRSQRYKGPLRGEVDSAIQHRLKLEEMSSNSVEDLVTQESLLAEANDRLQLLREAADILVSGYLRDVSEKNREEHIRLLSLTVNDIFEKGKTELSQLAKDELRGQPTFHWPLEFPEVVVERGGFDAFVGNPPFMGGQKITGNLGEEYREYLVSILASNQRGSADLCTYFFLRAKSLLRLNGQLGLLATNTIAQGDTREVGLDQLTQSGCVIPRAVPSRKWPGTASLEVAHVWVRSGTWNGNYILDDRSVTGITSFLTPTGSVTSKPYRLKANEEKCFQGSIVLGMGFVLKPEEAQNLIAKDPHNRDILFPYLNGEDLNSRPDQSPSRWVINFFDWPLDKAREYADCSDIVERTVKPERIANKYSKTAREMWWLYERWRAELYRTISGMERVIAVAATSRTLAFAFVSSKIVFSHATYVFALGDERNLALLQGVFHELWVRRYASSMKGDLRYTPSDCFETFPFPSMLSADLDKIGGRYHAYRCQVMLNRSEGLTKTYSRFHAVTETSNDIQKLRQLHVEIDNGVAAAYGWTDLDLGHDFHETKQGIRYTIKETARREVLARLLKLNHERYEEEVRQGLHEKKNATTTKSRKQQTATDVSPKLFE